MYPFTKETAVSPSVLTITPLAPLLEPKKRKVIQLLVLSLYLNS